MNLVVENKRLVIILICLLSILMIPLIAMNFSDEVNWKVGDFVVGGVLLVFTGLVIELVLRTFKTKKSRSLLILGIFIVLFLIWAELAVGIFDSPLSGS